VDGRAVLENWQPAASAATRWGLPSQALEGNERLAEALRAHGSLASRQQPRLHSVGQAAGAPAGTGGIEFSPPQHGAFPSLAQTGRIGRQGHHPVSAAPAWRSTCAAPRPANFYVTVGWPASQRATPGQYEAHSCKLSTDIERASGGHGSCRHRP